MNPIIKNSIIAASPLAFNLVHASPAASFDQINPPNGSTVRDSEVWIEGRMSHDIYPTTQIRAFINEKAVKVDPRGRFRARIPLVPGENKITLRATTPNPRQQINRISSFIDGSMVYGSDAARAKALRTLEGGRLKTSANNLPPLNTEGFANVNASPFPDTDLFLTGDVRGNENLELLAIHTLFIREHNLLADAIATAQPTLDDEAIYQQARRLVIAELQVITYQEFLPALLGKDALRPYRGYQPAVNPGISTEFATAAFRIGHTMINDDIGFTDNEGNDMREELPLAHAFFNPGPIKETGPDPLLKYLASDNAQEIDTRLVDGLRDFLFGPPGAGGLDLASLNIQRGRDHGIASYQNARKAYGLPPVKSLTDITRDPILQEALRGVYGDDVASLDLWVAGLAEDHVPGTSVGPTFRRILADQFARTRDGDSNWYERNFSGRQLAVLKATRLSEIIRRNTGITKLQDNVFFFDPASTLASLVEKPGKLPADLIRGRDLGNHIASLDGSGNHPFHASWGTVDSTQLRMAPAEYADGISEPAGSTRPGAREISNAVATSTGDATNARLLSSWIYGWGQFIDHDLSLTDTGTTDFNIEVPAGDPSFDPESTGKVIIPMTRSEFDPETGTASPAKSGKVLRITFRPGPRGTAPRGAARGR
jgi:hypothetical protein